MAKVKILLVTMFVLSLFITCGCRGERRERRGDRSDRQSQQEHSDRYQDRNA
jgi:hypothetical protein